MQRFSSQALSARLKQAASAAATATSAAATAAANASANLPSASTSLTAGEALKKGDLVVQAGDKLTYWADDPNGALAGLRPFVTASDSFNAAIVSPTTPLAASVPSNASHVGTAVCTLPGGNVVSVFGTLNADASTKVIGFAIYTPLGVLVAAPVLTALPFSSGDTSTSDGLQVTALAGGNFVISTGSKNVAPQFAIFDPTGAVVLAPTLVDSGTVRVYGQHLAALPGGGFAVSYFMTATYQIKLAIYNALGVLQGGAPTVGANPTLPMPNAQRFVKTLVLTGGNIATIYAQSNNSSLAVGIYGAVYTAAGVIVQAATLLLGATAVAQGSFYGFDAAATTDGGVGVVGNVANNNSVLFCGKFNGALAVQGAVLNGLNPGTSSNNNLQAIVALAGGGFLFANTSSIAPVGLQYFVVSSAGALLSGPAQISALTTFSAMQFVTLLDGSILLALVSFDTTNVIATGYSYRLRMSGNVVAAITGGTIPGTGQNAPSFALSVAPLVDGDTAAGFGFVIGWQTTGQSGGISNLLVLASAVVQKRILVGVALADAAKGSAVSVQILGAALLRLVMTKPVTLDLTASSPPGQKALLVGNAAILKGIQP